MKTYARINDGLVQEIFATDDDISKVFHPAMVWVDVTSISEIGVGWIATEIDNTWTFYALEIPAQVPSCVSMRQARLALLGAGLLAQVDVEIDALPSPQKEAARIEWEYSQEVQRNNGFVSSLAPALGLTEEQIDLLFITAAGL
jgi:hypothetical protein